HRDDYQASGRVREIAVSGEACTPGEPGVHWGSGEVHQCHGSLLPRSSLWRCLHPVARLRLSSPLLESPRKYSLVVGQTRLTRSAGPPMCTSVPSNCSLASAMSAGIPTLA